MAHSPLFGKYWPQESPVHTLDPRMKLIGLVLAMIGVFCATTYPALATAALFIVAFFVIARIPVHKALASIGPLFFIVILTAVLNIFFVQGGAEYVAWGPLRISQAGVHSAVFLSIRLTLLLLSASLLTLTTTTLDLTDALEDLLHPFVRFGVPAHEFAMVFGIALRFLPQFVQEAHLVRNAQLSRGAKEAKGFRGRVSHASSLMVPLFTSAFRHAETLSAGMDARCYHGGVGRTRLHPLAFSARDGKALVVLVVMIVCVIAVNLATR